MSSITTCHLYTYIFVSNLTCKWVVLSIKLCHLYNNIKCHWITHENWQHGEYKSEINHEQETKKKKKEEEDFLNPTSSCWVEENPTTIHMRTSRSHLFFFWYLKKEKLGESTCFVPTFSPYSYFSLYFLILQHLVPKIKKKLTYIKGWMGSKKYQSNSKLKIKL